MIWQDYLRLSDSHLTCIVKTNSLCLSTHEDVYISMSSGNYFYSYNIIPATINHNNVYKLQMIKHINCQFVVLHTCTQTLFHTRHICGVQKIFRRANNTKRLYFIEPFLIKSVRCKREHFLWWFLSRFILFNHCCHRFCLTVAAGMR